MSYRLHLRSPPCTHCNRRGDEPELPTPTYNLTPIFDLALTGESTKPLPNGAYGVVLRVTSDRPRGLRLLEGRVATDTLYLLCDALARLNAPEWRERFLDLQPSNGFGTLTDAIEVMTQLRDAAISYPDHMWEVH